MSSPRDDRRRVGHAQTFVGQLDCRVAGDVGFVVGSSRGDNCTYCRSDGLADVYAGSSGRLGLDFGATTAVDAFYDVVVQRPLGHRALEGGGSALDGGRERVTLVSAKNVSVTGIDVSAGLATLDLRYLGSEKPEHVERIYLRCPC